jgi:hypothetical protein
MEKENIMNNPRVYKNSPFLFVLLFLMFVLILVAVFFAAGDVDSSSFIVMGLFALVFVFLFIFLVFRAASQTIISDDEISTKNLLGTKSLRWNEISRVSGNGYAIKLHNFDGDVTVAPSPQLSGYNEVVDQIGVKRPDLFNPLEYGEMKKNWLGAIFFSLIGLLLFIGFGVFVLTQANDILFPFLVFVVFGAIAVITVFVTPQSISIQGHSIVVGYLFNQKTFSADEIAAIDLRYTQTRNGKNYFVAITLKNGNTIRVSGLSPSLPVVYLVLNIWHRKNAPASLINQQN